MGEKDTFAALSCYTMETGIAPLPVFHYSLFFITPDGFSLQKGGFLICS